MPTPDEAAVARSGELTKSRSSSRSLQSEISKKAHKCAVSWHSPSLPQNLIKLLSTNPP